MAEPRLHDEVAHLAFLVGTWAGEGAGGYPTITPFRYGERIEITHEGKAWLAYRQRTWSVDDDAPLHAETGFFRPAGPGRVELVLAHPNGVVDVEEGTLEGTTIALASTTVATTSTAKAVTALARTIRVAGDALDYEVAMAIAGQPLTPHLRATLRRA